MQFRLHQLPHIFLVTYLILDWQYWMTAYLYSSSITVQLQHYLDVKRLAWFLSLFGYEYAIMGTVACFWILSADKIKVLSLVVVIGVIYYIMAILKMIYLVSIVKLLKQPRPFFIFPQVGGLSCDFDLGNPSGHAFGALVVYTIFCRGILFDGCIWDPPRNNNHQVDSETDNSEIYDTLYPDCPIHYHVLILMFTTFIAAIGYSRVYVGSHSFNQVMLGWVLGIYSLYIYIKYEVKYDENQKSVIVQHFKKMIHKKDLDKKKWIYNLLYGYMFSSGVILSLYVLLQYNDALQQDELNWLSMIKEKCVDATQSPQLFFEHRSLRDSGIITFPIAISFMLIHSKGSYHPTQQRFSDFTTMLKKTGVLILLVGLPLGLFKLVTWLFGLKRYSILIYLLEGHILQWILAFQLVIACPYIYMYLSLDRPGDLMRKRYPMLKTTDLEMIT